MQSKIKYYLEGLNKPLIIILAVTSVSMATYGVLFHWSDDAIAIGKLKKMFLLSLIEQAT